MVCWCTCYTHVIHVWFCVCSVSTIVRFVLLILLYYIHLSYKWLRYSMYIPHKVLDILACIHIVWSIAFTIFNYIYSMSCSLLCMYVQCTTFTTSTHSSVPCTSTPTHGWLCVGAHVCSGAYCSQLVCVSPCVSNVISYQAVEYL